MMHDLVERTLFNPPQSPRAYGFEGGKPIEQPNGPSTYLLPWDVLDDESDRVGTDRPSMYVITGEYVTDGVRHPMVAIAPAYMKWAGYYHAGHAWKRMEMA